MRRQQADPRERRHYLEQLVTEFKETTSKGNKHQVLANLANFAYDPINFESLRQLCVIELFIDQLSETDDSLVEFAIGGLCNLALDPLNKERIRRKDGIRLIMNCLSSSVEEIVLSSITTLMFLITPETRKEIVTPFVIDCMQRYSQSENRRLSNLATVFMNDFSTS